MSAILSTVRWQIHDFNVYEHGTTTWNDVGCVYIFAGRNANDRWVAWYIGETVSFKDRIPFHERWVEAMLRGATHVHAMAVKQEANRAQIQDGLIRLYQPPLNTQER